MKKKQKIEISLELISKYRGSIMGLAIILIMFTHNSMVFPSYFGKINSGIRMLAQSGVDIFFLLSGLGCYYSLQSKSIKKFYQKRIVRIFCPYIVILVTFGLYRVCLRGDSFFEYLFQYGLVSFFTKAELSEWFIAAILVTYLFTPLLFKLLKYEKKFFVVLFILFYFIIAISRIYFGNYHVYNVIVDIWFTRLPSYLLGMLIAKRISEKNNTLLSDKQIYSIIIVAVICMVITMTLFSIKFQSYWLINRLLFLPMILGVVLIFVCVLEQTKGKLLVNALKWLGGITLEIYLLHEKVLGICDGIVKYIIHNNIFASIVSNILAVILAVCLAKLLNLLIDRFLSRIKMSSRALGSPR